MDGDFYQYRITINGSVGQVESYSGEKWARIAEILESRGGYAKLERRFVTDKSFLDYQPDNVMILGEKVVTHWTTIAELDL